MRDPRLMLVARGERYCLYTKKYLLTSAQITLRTYDHICNNGSAVLPGASLLLRYLFLFKKSNLLGLPFLCKIYTEMNASQRK